MPAGAEMDPESCYLGFEIRLQTRSSKADIERVFDFCRDDCELRILPPNSKLAEYVKLIKELPEDDMRLGEMLVRCGALTQGELDGGLNSQQTGAQGNARRRRGGAQAAVGRDSDRPEGHPQGSCRGCRQQADSSQREKGGRGTFDPGACRQAGSVDRSRRRTGNRRCIGQLAGATQRAD